MSAPAIRPMSAEQARAIVEAIHERVREIRELVFDLHEREGWKALGYKTWEECVTAEFGKDRSTLYRHLRAAMIGREIVSICDGKHGHPSDAIPDSQLLALAPLPEPEQRREAWEEAKATAPGGKVTAKHIEGVVAGKLGGSIVNGVASPDPPDVAEKRAAGRIAPDAVVEVIEPGPAEEPEVTPEPAAEPDESELDDDAWLQTLPLRARLSGAALRWFEIDALLYRTLEPARGTFLHHASRALAVARRRGGNGEYGYRVGVFLKLDHPRHWKPCPRPDDGGCGGVGTVGVIGQCPRCRGRGYLIL